MERYSITPNKIMAILQPVKSMSCKRDSTKVLECYWHICLPASDNYSQFMKANLFERTHGQAAVANVETLKPG